MAKFKIKVTDLTLEAVADGKDFSIALPAIANLSFAEMMEALENKGGKHSILITEIKE